MMAKKDELDPLNINGRLYKQIGKLLDDMEAADRDEKMTMPQRINALIAVGRVQTIFSNLRKASADDPERQGASVRKYAEAFSANAANRRAPGARPTEPDDPAGEIGDELGPDAA